MTRILSVVAIAALAACTGGAAAAPGGSGVSAGGAGDLVWEGTISRGKTVWIRNLNGPVKAVPTTGRRVVVRAVTKTKAGHRPAPVDLVAVPHDGTVTVCALWPAKQRSCKARGNMSHTDSKSNHTSVHFEVLVPAGVRMDLATVNGSVRTGKLGADVQAESVNGQVHVETTTGSVQARTVNGGVVAVVGNTGGDVTLETVNGSIDADVPTSFNANVTAQTVNGSISSDLPIAGKRATKRSLSGQLGNGGRALSMSTVNGSIEIR